MKQTTIKLTDLRDFAAKKAQENPDGSVNVMDSSV